MVYTGRFAPSPSGHLHAGSLVAALASFLDARVHGGEWLLRIEDVDEARTVPGAAQAIMDALKALGMDWDGDVLWQSARKAHYEAACARLGQHVFPCSCTRREIADSRLGTGSDGAPIYPGTCRHGLAPGRQARALRLRVPDIGDPAGHIRFHDRWQGLIEQDLATEVGDFVLRRADGFWAYQLAVVVDDAEQGITHVVRGADLLDSTARQIYLQRLLGHPEPAWLHVPTVNNERGEKLSKQTGARSLDLCDPLARLQEAAAFLGLETEGASTTVDFWRRALPAWEDGLLRRQQQLSAAGAQD